MKNQILALSLISLFAACDAEVKTPPTTETKETTIVNPASKDTTVVAPMPEKETVKEKETIVTPPATTPASESSAPAPAADAPAPATTPAPAPGQ